MKGFRTAQPTHKTDHLNPKTTIRTLQTEENHQVNDYGMLNKVINNHLKKKKKKTPATARTYSDSLSHCQSLDHLQLLNVEKNQEIKRYIYEKASIHAENEQLRQMINNPTMREHQLHLKISQLEETNRQLKSDLERQEKAHRQEVQRMRNQYKLEVERINERYRVNESSYRNNENTYRANQNTLKVNQNNYKASQNNYRVNDTKFKVSEPTQYRPTEIKTQPYKYDQNTFIQSKPYEVIKPAASQNTQQISKNVQQSNQNIQQPNQSNIHAHLHIQQPSQPVKTYISPSNDNRNAPTQPYVVGSPVYISANKSPQQKQTVRQFSPDSSKNTTSQTLPRHESPRVVPSTFAIPQRNKQYQVISVPVKPNQQVKYESFKSYQPAYKANKVNDSTSFSRAIQVDRSPNKGYGQNDLQQIYKKYCISD